MLIAIISDIHDNLANLEKCLLWCNKNSVEKILCLGDVTTIETIKYLTTKFSGEIFLVAGNGEIYQEKELQKYPSLHYCGLIGIIELAGLNLGLTHEHPEVAKIMDLAPSPLDFIFYGHTHKPWLEKRGGTTIVNPGNLAGVFHQATFATLESTAKKLELKILTEI